MELRGGTAVVTGGASGLGHATARAFIDRDVPIVIVDLATSDGQAVADSFGKLATFVPADVTDSEAVEAALDRAESVAPIRALVHCAGRGGTVRLVERDGSPGSLELYETIVRTNLVGTFNVLHRTAARMAKNEPVEGESGVCVLTSSVAAYEGQIGQIAYAASKAGIVGMTIVAARDLASRFIRVATIAPGIFDTPILARFSEEIRDGLARSIPHPARLGHPEEFASLALHIVDNPMINGETIRLDGAVRMQAR